MRGEYVLSNFARLGPLRLTAHANFAVTSCMSSTARLTRAVTTAHALSTRATICAVCILGQDLAPNINFRAVVTSGQDLAAAIHFLTHSILAVCIVSRPLDTARCMRAHDECLSTCNLLQKNCETAKTNCAKANPSRLYFQGHCTLNTIAATSASNLRRLRGDVGRSSA
jgi:hypothetical protein